MRHFSLALLVGLVCWCSAVQAAVWHAAELWQDLPGESVLRVYMFNVTNREEFLEDPHTHKPILQQVGPYVYRVRHQKIEASQQFDDQSIRFKQQKWYQFDPQASAPLTEDDEINIPNLQFLIYGTRIEVVDSYLNKNCIDYMTGYYHETMIRTNTVRDILFNGMDSEMYVEREKCIEEMMYNNEPVPPGFEAYEDGRYSYFKNKNGSDFGELRVQSTLVDGYGGIITLDHSDSLSYWNESRCNGIEGTSDGSVFPPSSTGTSPNMLFAYLPELYRAVMLNRDGSENNGYIGTGIQAGRYILADTFLNYTQEHSCWCIDECLPDGALNIQSATLGAPYAISQPGFRNSDPSYSEAVSWADQSYGGEDEPSYWIVEPSTGTVLESKRRFQLNIRVGALKKTTYFRDFPEIMFPVLWMEETYKLDDESLQSLKSALESDGNEPEPEDPTTTTTPTTTAATGAPIQTSTSTAGPTTTVKPTEPDPYAGQYLSSFKQLHNDVDNLGKKILFSTLAMVLLLVAILILSFLALSVRLRESQRRPRQIRSEVQPAPVVITQKPETVPYGQLN